MSEDQKAGGKDQSRSVVTEETTVPKGKGAPVPDLDETTVHKAVTPESPRRSGSATSAEPAIDPILAGATFRNTPGDTRPRSALKATEAELERTRPVPPVSAPSFTPSAGSAFGAASAGTPATPPVGAVPPAAAPAPVTVDAPPGDIDGPVRPTVRPQPTRRTRKARLRLTRVDPWSVMKTAFLFAIAFGVMMWVAVFVVWSVIDASGLFDSVNKILNDTLGSPDGTSNFQLQDYINTSRVLGYTALLSVVNIVITTALCTLFAFLYNLSATVLGGLEVTLAED